MGASTIMTKEQKKVYERPFAFVVDGRTFFSGSLSREEIKKRYPNAIYPKDQPSKKLMAPVWNGKEWVEKPLTKQQTIDRANYLYSQALQSIHAKKMLGLLLRDGLSALDSKEFKEQQPEFVKYFNQAEELYNKSKEIE